MLIITNKIVTDTINHLNENYKIDEDVIVNLIPGYETIADENGEVEYYVFDKTRMEIFIPTLVLNRGSEEDENHIILPYEVDSLEYKIGIIKRIGTAYYNTRRVVEDYEYSEKDEQDFCEKILKEILQDEYQPVSE